ncbi:poly polymerase tankyrase [Caerostris darwini]|uniref:Poly [ADP-ribose] polymerase n=1 Tax=Caerostris darwini TaxID=1538125 RepID=A0AAV4RAI6_9ARAC|nr:poly polymerase tankyrase [Caerostris darwini]
MPSTRRVAVRENEHRTKRTRPPPVLESEPQDLRISKSVVMDQNVETNGCDDGPISLAVSNHNDVVACATKTDKQMAKSLSAQEGKKPRQAASNAKGNRARRNTPTNPPNSTPSTSPPSERRATRNLPPPSPIKQVTRTPTAAERKAIKNITPIPAVNTQPSGKKSAAHPPTLSPQVAGTGAAPVLSQETTITSPTNLRLVKNAQQSQLHSSPPTLKSQKRNLKRQSEAADLDGASGRASKRVRLQHQPFQSPPPPTIIPAILRQQVIKTPEDKIVVFNKGEFLAVRNENGSFFVCRTAQNVYKSSKRFKIQWMSDKESDIYIPDFYDQTDFECVLTNLRLKRLDKNKFQLPSEERQRTLNILQRALNVENGMDISQLQVTTDGVDVSIVGKEDEEILRLQQETLKTEQKSKISQLRTKAATRAANRGRPKRPEPIARMTKASTAAVDNKSKTLAAKVKLRARETVKVKLKKEGGRIIVSNKARKPVTKLKKIAERLHPNPKVTLFEKDPTFETNIQIPYVSSSAHSKLLIRAVLLKDINMLQSLMKDTQKICSLSTYRSVDVQLTPLMYAVLKEDHRSIKALLNVERRKYANPPQTLLEHQRSGRYNMAMLGHAVKPIAASRGGREGNNAFLKDINFCDKTYPSVTDDLLIEALKSGVSMATFKFLLSQNNDYQSWYSWKNGKLLDHIHIAVRNGYYKLAGQLVKEALERGGYGFNNLHKEVLLNDRQPLTPFKTVSIVKKCQGNARITPLHCAAINPNSQYLTALLSSTPEYNLPDENGWRPIHYASVCKSTGPLELLISRNVSLEEPESDGNTALHVAALAGRAQNVDLILRHLIASEHNRKETAITVSLQDKQCVNAIDKGNKKSYTALHLACQRGHTDVVKVLIKHKANVDKLTNAQHDKLTPLMFASQKGHLDVVKLLVEHNAQVEMKDKKQRTALTHGVINGHTHITSFLLRLGANPNATDTSGNTLVHYAAAYGWYFSLKLLIEAGASLNLKNDWKITPLSLAFMKGHMGLVDFLVEQPGIDINVDFSNDSGMSLVMQALRSRITHSMLERIHFLVVKQKSDCTKLDFMGNNALHHLVMAEVGEVYIDAKMESSEENSDSESSSDDSEAMSRIKAKSEEKQLFKEEAQQEHDDLIQEITKLLLDHGCDPMVRNKEGESPFNLAVKEGCLLLVKMFLDAGCELNLDVSHSGDNILHYLVTHARNRKVEPMLQAILNAKCSSPDSTPHQLLCQMAKMYNKNGHTPLLQALHTLGSCRDKESQNRLLTFAKVLLDELGADVSAPCKKEDGKEASYALHLGTKCDGGRVIEVLLAHKPPLNVFDEHGQSPLILAIKEENTEAVEALIKAGANVNLKSNDKDKISPLLLASKNVKLGKIVQLLVHNKADVCDVDKKNKNTALHYVVSVRAQNVLETGKTLLTAGADVNALNDKQRTPLHLSINASKSDTDSSYSIEECLLGFGARLDALDCRHRIPLHYAFVKINKPFDCSVIDPMELISLLTDSMSKESLAIADDFGRTPLHYAAYRGATTCVCHLVKLCNNVEYKDKDGNTALGLAVKNNHFSVVMHLLQSGANCVADIISPVESIKRKGPEPLKWIHAKKPPAVPEKHTILQETLLKDWQGILFVMLGQLDALKKGINIAVEAALRTAKYNVALKLIGRIKNSWMLYSEKQSMLHVLAREAPPDYLPELQVKVAQFLIEKGVPVMAKDEHGCSVLTYAAVNRNHTLCSFFATKMSLPVASKLDPDRSLRTPFSAIFWKLTSEDLSDDIRNWCCNLIKAGANPNVLTQYPIEMNPFPGVRCTILNSLHIEDPNAPKYTPLIMAIYQSNYTVVKLLLNKGADVNFSDDKKRTPLMHAVRLNDIKMVKLLLNFNYDPSKDKNPYSEVEPGSFQKTSTANLAAQDVNGWTVVHYIVDPLPDYCYANTSLLNFLAELGAPLDTVNVAGESALQIATRLQRDILVTALEKLLNTPEDQKIKIELSVLAPPSDDVQWDQPISSYVEDSKLYLEKMESEQMDTSSKFSLEPDSLSDFETTGEIVMDTEKDVPYDIVMTVVDLNYGAYGIYNFYKMQIIKHKNKDLFILFTCWGRVGDTGQYQKTPFSTLPEAVKEFSRIFRAKSGNSWDDVKNFQPQPKKYRLVQLEKKFNKQLSIKLNLKSDVPSKLSTQKQELVEHLMNVHTIEDTLQNLGVNAHYDVLPFGSLREETLSAAEKVLKDIGDIITEKDNLRQNVKSQEKFAELMHKIVKLSEEFYQLLPVYGFQYEKLCPLFSAPDVHSKLKLIHNLKHIGLSSQLILGASLKVSEINPKDYVYRSLNCNLSLLNPDSQEAQMILQYIHNTGCKQDVGVQSIYAVHIPEQVEQFRNTKLANHMLLWHGTRLSNMLSILSHGLQVAPLGAQMNGDLFGKGIYFADMFKKSEGYCMKHHSLKMKCILLCEVALGDCKEIEYNLVIDPAEKYDSVKAVGRRQPDPSKNVYWKGMTVPVGEPVNALEQGTSSSHHYLNFNEYVVYNASQVCVRYLIQFTDRDNIF